MPPSCDARPLVYYRWSSSFVYSTTPSRGSISSSWYLYKNSWHVADVVRADARPALTAPDTPTAAAPPGAQARIVSLRHQRRGRHRPHAARGNYSALWRMYQVLAQHVWSVADFTHSTHIRSRQLRHTEPPAGHLARDGQKQNWTFPWGNLDPHLSRQDFLRPHESVQRSSNSFSRFWKIYQV